MEGKSSLKDFVFVFTGEMAMPRDEARNLVVALGARATTAISGKTTHLVTGTDPGVSKIAKAQELGVKIIDADTFSKMINATKSDLETVITTDISSACHDSIKKDSSCATSGSVKVLVKNELKEKCDVHSASVVWAEKYRPNKRDELVGNPGVISQLNDFLCGKTAHSSALLSGPPGVGKTTAALVMCRENNIQPIEFNASDYRNKSSLTALLGGITSGISLDNNLKMVKRVIIMDEVDGMTSDRGGVPELVKLIKKRSFPIICICNDHTHPKMRTLASNCLDLRFRKLDSRSIFARIKHVLLSEGKQLSDSIINEVILRCGGDMRYTLNTLQNILSMKAVSGADVMRMLNTKNIAKGPFELTTEMFKRNKVNTKTDLYFEDYTFIPLFIHENYIKCKMGFDTLRLASESISFSDVQDTRIHGASQDWSLMPYHAFSSCVYPTNGLTLFSKIDFPSYLGQMSKLGKNMRILLTLQRHCKFKLGGHCWKHYVLPLLNGLFMKCMSIDDVQGVLKLLVETDLLKDDILAVNSLINESYKEISTKSKALFTREYKKLKRTLPYSLEEEKDQEKQEDSEE